MIVSRSANILKTAKFLKQNLGQIQHVKNSHHWSYRSALTSQPKIITYSAEIVAGFAWWWILWHLWTEPGHVTGEFDYPDASKWSDEELGISSDE